MVYSKNGCTRKPALDGKLRKSILIVFSLQPLCLRMQQMKPYPRKHTHTRTATYRSLLLTPSLPSLHLSFPIQINTIDQLAIRLQNDHITINTHTHTRCHCISPENEWMAIIKTGWLVRPRLAAPNHQQQQQRCGLCVGCIDLVMAASYAVGQC